MPEYLTEPLPNLVPAAGDTPQAVLESYARNAEAFAQCYARYPRLVRALRERELVDDD